MIIILKFVYSLERAPNSSSETRLVVSENAKTRDYDSKKYENQMYRFNNFDRANCYEHEYGDLDGLDHCYDCRGEVFVFTEYINKCQSFMPLYQKMELKWSGCCKSVRDYVQELNEHLNAKNKVIRITYDNKTYETQFTKIKYGKQLKEVCRETNNSDYKKWSKPTNISQLLTGNLQEFDPKRLNFSGENNRNRKPKRLQGNYNNHRRFDDRRDTKK